MTAQVETPRSISFERAWRKFLLVRPFMSQIMITYHKDGEQRIIGVDAGPVQVMWTEQNTQQRYLVDSTSIPGVLFGFPEEIVKRELETKVFSKIIGRVFTEEQLDQIKRKLNEHLEKGGRRLGCANMRELAKEISGGNYWEALFSLHQLIHYRLRMLTRYKSGELDTQRSQITIDPLKEKICDIRNLSHLVDVAFAMGAIDKSERLKILSFNSERDTIAHRLLTRKIDASSLRTVCEHGLEAVGMLQNSLSRIIPKPAIITVKRFEIQELPHYDIEHGQAQPTM